MKKKGFIILALLSCLVVWSSLAQATPISYSLSYDNVYAYADNGTNSDSDATASASSVAVLASVPHASASFAGPSGLTLFTFGAQCDGIYSYASITGNCAVSFTAPANGDATFKFSYTMTSTTNGYADASAQLLARYYNFVAEDPDKFLDVTANAGSFGTQDSPNDTQTKTNTVTYCMHGLTQGQGYELDLTLLAGTVMTYDTSLATATGNCSGTITFISLETGGCEVPLPGGLLLLSAGLVRVAAWTRRRVKK